jgi:polysaccharide pyruvyl transferase WcaK-like protein
MTSRRSLLRNAAGAALALPAMRASPAGRPFEILLLSGWNIKNIGDVAHTPGFLRLSQRFLPEAHCTVAVGSMKYYQETGDYLRERFPDFGVVPRPYTGNKMPAPEFQEAFNRADILVLSSGMTMSYGYYGHSWDNYMGNVVFLTMARNAGKAFGVYGHSFDKMDPPADVIIGGLLTAANFVYTRDGESLKLIRSKGVRCPEMAFGPDAAFGFDLRNKKIADGLMRHYQLESGKFLVFIPRLDLKRFDQREERSQRLAQSQREMVIDWVRHTGEPVMMVAEVEGQIKPARELIYDRLPDDVRKLVRFKPDFWWPDEATSLYLEARALASLEMHSVIMALAAGIPALHPYFTEAGLKQYMMRDIGLEEWMFDIDQHGSRPTSDALREVYRDTAAARGKVSKAMAYVEQRERHMMDFIRQSALKGGSAG